MMWITLRISASIPTIPAHNGQFNHNSEVFMNNAPTRCKECSRFMRMIRLGVMSFFCVLGIPGPSANAAAIDAFQEAVTKYWLAKINQEKKQQKQLLSQLIAANDDLASLNRDNPYLPNKNIKYFFEELTPVYNDMILTQRIAKVVDALKNELLRQQTILSELTGQNKGKLQEIKEEIVKRTKIYKDFICADRKGTSSKVNTKKVCSSKIKDPSPVTKTEIINPYVSYHWISSPCPPVTKAEIINPYVALLEKLQNITQQLAQAYPSEETDSAGENPSPTWIKQIAELEQDIQELITLGQIIKEENQA